MLFDRLGGDEDDVIWEDLVSSLYHQGSVYSASFVALPLLADVAMGRRPGDGMYALCLAGSIVAAEEQEHPRGYVLSKYPQVIAELRPLTERAIGGDCLGAHGLDYLEQLQLLLAFEGVPVWGAELSRMTYEVVCPACSSPLEIDVSPPECGVRRRDSDLVSFNSPRPTDGQGRPVPPDELNELAARLHGLAVGAGEDAAAEALTLIFGHAPCPNCGTVFSIPQQIEAGTP